jgi:hypothetical protein
LNQKVFRQTSALIQPQLETDPFSSVCAFREEVMGGQSDPMLFSGDHQFDLAAVRDQSIATAHTGVCVPLVDSLNGNPKYPCHVTRTTTLIDDPFSDLMHINPQLQGCNYSFNRLCY